MRNGGKGREKPPLSSRRGRPGHRGHFAPIRPRHRPIVNRHPTEVGKGLAIFRPGVMGLTVHHAPPFAPPGCCHPLATTRRFRRAISVLSTDCREAAVGVRGRPETASGGRCRSPLPGAPSGDPTPITQSVEELVLPTPFLDFPGNALGGAGKTRFFGHKYLADQLRGVYFGPLMGGMGAHSHNFFGMWEIPVTR